jgi:hypothetical protein
MDWRVFARVLVASGVAVMFERNQVDFGSLPEQRGGVTEVGHAAGVRRTPTTAPSPHRPDCRVTGAPPACRDFAAGLIGGRTSWNPEATSGRQPLTPLQTPVNADRWK